jgi:carbamoyltransferase
VLQEHVRDWFDLPEGQESPYMLIVSPVREDRRVPIPPEQKRMMETDPDLRHRVNVVRSAVPAVTHVDYSARLQTIDEERNPRTHALLTAFHELTGCPVLVNTSFNVRGEPIVCTPQDAFRCFLGTEMDALVLGNFVLHKEEMKQELTAAAREEYLAGFQLD